MLGCVGVAPTGYGVGPERGLYFDGPGATSLRFENLPFRGMARDLYPINRAAIWTETFHEYST